MRAAMTVAQRGRAHVGRLQRSERMGLRTGRAHGKGQLEEANRRARGHAVDGLHRRAERRRVRTRGVVGGNTIDQIRAYPLLHVSGQRHGHPRQGRIGRVEDLHGGPAEEDGRDHNRNGNVRSVGRGVWSTPTVDAARGVLYITTGDNYSHPATDTSDAVMALDLKTGHIVWSQQTTPNDVYNSSCGGRGTNCPAESGPDYDFGGSAMLVRTPDGRDVLVAGQKSGVVYALDPANKGKLLWQTRVGKGRHQWRRSVGNGERWAQCIRVGVRCGSPAGRDWSRAGR